MTAAQSVERPTSRATAEKYAARLKACVTGQDMNALAEEIAGDRTITAAHRAKLQLRFESQMRLNWPRSFRSSR